MLGHATSNWKLAGLLGIVLAIGLAFGASCLVGWPAYAAAGMAGADDAAGLADDELAGGGGQPADVQGEPHPQDTLTVTVNDPYAKADESAAKTGKTTSTTFTADADSSLVPVDSETGRQGSPLGARTETYTMTIPGEDETTVEGRGSNLAMLLDAVGVGVDEQKRVESVDFISAEMGTTSVAWSDLVAVSRDYIIVAPKSYVHELNGEGAAAAGGADLLENTRYRVLYNGTLGSASPLSLRYVNRIVVNMGEPEQAAARRPLSVSIDCKPAAEGAEACLLAVPDGEFGASRLACRWEISTDGGKTWSACSDQLSLTLRVLTEAPPYGHAGRMFRAVLETDLLDDEGNPRCAVSEPVTITASSNFTVVLDYVPPLAGDTANFEAHAYNLDAGDKVTSWVWEANMGDGWQPIPGAANAPSWSTPTSAVEESGDDAGDDDGAAAIMTYVRVRATTESGKTATSNEQPLTVREAYPTNREMNSSSSSKTATWTPATKVNTKTVAPGVKVNAETHVATVNKVVVRASDVRAAVRAGATKFVLGAKVARVAPRAFAGARKVTSVTVGRNVGKLGARAFEGCAKLRAVVVKSPKLAKKASVKGCLKGSRVTFVKLSGMKAAQKAKVKRAFKKHAGKAVRFR